MRLIWALLFCGECLLRSKFTQFQRWHVARAATADAARHIVRAEQLDQKRRRCEPSWSAVGVGSFRQLRAKQCGRRFDDAQLSAAWAQSKACIFIPRVRAPFSPHRACLVHGGALSWPLRTPDRGCALGACLCPRPNRLPMGETTASSSCRTSCRCCYAVTPLPRRAPRPWTCASAISVIRSRSPD